MKYADSANPTVTPIRRQQDRNGANAIAGQLQRSVQTAVQSLLDRQHAKGYWSFELEADCTIPAEYILMMHFMDEIDAGLQTKLAVYIRARQNDDGGWPLYYGGDSELSCSVKAYYALKLAGDSAELPHMQHARDLILSQGGAAKSNVFTRIALAQFQQTPWRAVPFMPVELLLLPDWFPFHIYKVSYWSRTVMVPLFILYSLRAQAKNPTGTGVQELFVISPEQEKAYFQTRSRLNWAILQLERSVRLFEPLIPGLVRKQAIARAKKWFIERLNGEDGLGAIFPAMVNAYQCLAELGYERDDPLRQTARKALENLLVECGDYAYCQPCVSPIWDTGLACLALQETEGVPRVLGKRVDKAVRSGLDWLKQKQITDVAGDWQVKRPGLEGGGWAFQFGNDHYPDLDDTAVVGWAMHNAGHSPYDACVDRAANWIAGLQSRNGGFAAFDADNTHYYLNEIPFADHGALLDPPTADVSARCLALLGRLDRQQDATVLWRCLQFIQREQEADGAWFGRWGTNYIYGTWSVLSALEQAGVDMQQDFVAKAVHWLKRTQQEDGGWGESNDSYEPERLDLRGTGIPSTPCQTAWAMLALMAAGEAQSAAAGRAARYLIATQRDDGLWHSPEFNAPGFPRVFYLRYHGYNAYFPLWALARYRKLISR